MQEVPQAKPQIFISAVSEQFKECRDALRTDLAAVGADVKVQEEFQQHGGTLLEKLEKYIASCDRVIALVGSAYGCEPEPAATPANAPSRSYTQWEYHFASGERLDGTQAKAKPVYVYFALARYLEQHSVEQSDVAALRQQEFIDQIRSSGKDRNKFDSIDELVRLVLLDGFKLSNASKPLPHKRPSSSADLRLFRNGIENFLNDYLGTDEKPEPFGGRADKIAEFNAWLVDTDANPRRLLVTPAGRGKSAFLVRWIDQVGPDWRIVFVPISIRCKTDGERNFYKFLALALGELLGEELIDAAISADQAQDYKHTVAEYLHELCEREEEQVLVVIDGLDEATGWSFDAKVVPPGLPTKLRIVLSAREQLGDHGPEGWLERLDWDAARPPVITSQLPKLDAARIGDVLTFIGGPLTAMATDIDVTTELERLTKGEPILVRYYAEDLRGKGEEVRRLKPSELKGLDPGFDPYFRKWLLHQEKVDAVISGFNRTLMDWILAVLSVAEWPLLHQELEAIVDRLPGDSEISSTETLESLRRFVLGDGVENGYILQHPKLAEFLCRDYLKGPKKPDEAINAILKWGAETVRYLNEGVLPPQQASRYLLDHYPQILIANKQPADAFIDLVSDGWRRAWAVREEGNLGFRADVLKAFKAFKAHHLQFAQQFRCVLCLSSIASLGSNYPSELLRLSLEKKMLDPGRVLNLVRQKQDPADRQEALLEVMVLLPHRYESEALEIAREFADAQQRAETLVHVARHLSSEMQEEVYRDGVDAALFINDHKERADMLVGLAPTLPDAMKTKAFRGALEAAQKIDSKKDSAKQLADILPDLPPELEVEGFRSALSAAEEIDEESRYLEAKILLARNAPIANRPQLVKEALVATREIDDNFTRIWALQELVSLFDEAARVEVLQEWLYQASRNLRERYFASWLAELAPEIPPSVIVATWEFASSVCGDAGSQAEISTAFIPHMPSNMQQELFSTALDAIRRVDWNDKARTEKLLRLGAMQEISVELQQQACHEILALAREIQTELDRAEVLAMSISHFPDSLKDEAVAAVRSIGDPRARADLLVNLMSELSEDNRAKAIRKTIETDAFATVMSLEKSKERAHLLTVLVPNLQDHLRQEAVRTALKDVQNANISESDRTSMLIQLADYWPEGVDRIAFGSAQKIEDSLVRAGTMTKLVSLLPEELMSKAYDEAQTAVEAILDQEIHVWGMVKLARTLKDELREQAAKDALVVAKSIQSVRTRAEYLMDLIPVLPDEQQPEATREALGAARKIDDNQYRAESLIQLAPILPVEQRFKVVQEALSAARGVSDLIFRVGVLAKLNSQLSDDLQVEVSQEVLAAVRTIGEEDESASFLLLVLATDLRGNALFEVVNEALDIYQKLLSAGRDVREINLDRWLHKWGSRLCEPLLEKALGVIFRYRGATHNALSAIGPYLSTELARRTVVKVKTIEDEERRAELLSSLAPNLSQPLKEEVFHETLPIMSALPEETRTRILEELASDLPEVLVIKAMEITGKINDLSYRARAVSAVAERLPAKPRAKAYRQLIEQLSDTRTGLYEYRDLHCLKALEALSPVVPEEFLPETLAVAGSIDDEWYRVDALSAVAPRLPSDKKIEAFQEALRTVLQGELHESDRVTKLRDLILILPEELVGDAFAEAIDIGIGLKEFLTTVGPDLPESLKAIAVASVTKVQGEQDQMELLTELLPYMQDFLPEVLNIARNIKDAAIRASVLVAMVPHLPEELYADAMEAALHCYAGLSPIPTRGKRPTHPLHRLYVRQPTPLEIPQPGDRLRVENSA